MALRWEDVDLAKCLIHVERAYDEKDRVHIEPKSRDQFATGGQPQTGDDKLQLIKEAREAIAAGAPEAAVRERLAKMGVSL